MYSNQFFFDHSRWKFTAVLTQSYDALLEDYNRLVAASDVWTASNSNYNNVLISSKNWHLIPFITKGIYHTDNIEQCPTVKKLLNTIPIYDNCLFSKIDGGGIVPPHTGFSDHHLRVHLGMQTDGQAWIRVGNQVRHWKNQQVLIFHDWDEHEVQNPSAESRVIFVFDIEKQSYFDNLI